MSVRRSHSLCQPIATSPVINRSFSTARSIYGRNRCSPSSHVEHLAASASAKVTTTVRRDVLIRDDVAAMPSTQLARRLLFAVSQIADNHAPDLRQHDVLSTFTTPLLFYAADLLPVLRSSRLCFVRLFGFSSCITTVVAA